MELQARRFPAQALLRTCRRARQEQAGKRSDAPLPWHPRATCVVCRWACHCPGAPGDVRGANKLAGVTGAPLPWPPRVTFVVCSAPADGHEANKLACRRALRVRHCPGAALSACAVSARRRAVWYCGRAAALALPLPSRWACHRPSAPGDVVARGSWRAGGRYGCANALALLCRRARCARGGVLVGAAGALLPWHCHCPGGHLLVVCEVLSVRRRTRPGVSDSWRIVWWVSRASQKQKVVSTFRSLPSGSSLSRCGWCAPACRALRPCCSLPLRKD